MGKFHDCPDRRQGYRTYVELMADSQVLSSPAMAAMQPSDFERVRTADTARMSPLDAPVKLRSYAMLRKHSAARFESSAVGGSLRAVIGVLTSLRGTLCSMPSKAAA